MLKKLRPWRAWILGGLALIALVWIVESSQPFQSCVNEAQYQAGEQSLKKRIADFSILARQRKDCLGALIHRNESAITALATIFIALFTLTLWQSTDRLWEASDKQAQLTRDSLELARKEFEYTFRARISIFDVAIEHGGGRPNISVKFRLENTGGVPATGLMISFNISTGPDWHPPTRDTFYVAPQREEMSLVLAAKESVQKEEAIRDFTAEDYRKAGEHGVPHYLRFGIVVAYRDGFDCERITWKWFEWSSDTGSFRECAARQD
jgi:hypothetical protein